MKINQMINLHEKSSSAIGRRSGSLLVLHNSSERTRATGSGAKFSVRVGKFANERPNRSSVRLRK